MKELFQQYAAHNFWATKLLVDVIKALPEENYTKEIPSSFPSLYKTIQHMWLAEEVWWKRHKLVENIVIESEKFEGSFTELVNHFTKQSQQWKAWVDGCTEAQLQHVFAYIRQKEQYKLPTYQMLLHIFNHATYHRGQLVTMLRNLGVTKIPSTDFSTFCLLK
jgi:uncharacterized damage-inducible protein DinB